MLNLTRTTQKQLLRLLVPLLTNENSRDNLIYAALGFTDRARTLVADLDVSGSPHDFTISLIRQLASYGTVTDDEHGEIEALWAVMLAVRDRVGENHQRTIDGLAAELNPITTSSAVEVSNSLQIASDGAHVFISYSRANLSLVNRLVADLTAAGVPLWVDQVGLKAGTPDWEQAIRAAIREARCVFLAASPTSQRSAYVRDELAIADMYEVPIYPLWVDGEQWMDCIPMGRGYTQFIDLRGDAYSSNFADVLAAVGETSDTPEAQPDISTPPLGFVPRNPYKGLRAFTDEDRADFFGREALVAKLVDALRDSRFLAIIGPSGSGKSSVAMAGLLPALEHDGAILDSTEWVYLQPIVPGANPLDALRRALAHALPHKSQTAIREDLAHGSTEGLAMLADEAAGYDPDKRVVLYIDQFEELFTLTHTDADRDQFVNLLTTALTDPDNAMTVVITLRADFAYLLSAYTELIPLAEANTIYVPPMRINDLYTIIEQPTRADDVRLTFESGLVEEIVFAFREEYAASTGTLPLLQFTLERLFAQRDGIQLTWDAYHAIGGVHGAIGTHAEAVFEGLDEDIRTAFSQVFMRLVSVDERGTPTRQRAELDALTTDDNAAKLVQAFTNNRLLVTGTANDDTRYAEVAHEALLSNWTRLVDWTGEIGDKLRLLREVERAAAAWDAAGRPDYLAWKHERMAQVYDVQRELGYDFVGVTSEFVRPEWEVLLEQFKAELEGPAQTKRSKSTGSLLERIERPRRFRHQPDKFKLITIIDRMAEIGEPAAGVLFEAWKRTAIADLSGYRGVIRRVVRNFEKFRLSDIEMRFHKHFEKIGKPEISQVHETVRNAESNAVKYYGINTLTQLYDYHPVTEDILISITESTLDESDLPLEHRVLMVIRPSDKIFGSDYLNANTYKMGLRHLSSEFPIVRSWAVDVLSVAEDDSYVASITPMAQDPDKKVRQSVAETLGKIGGIESLDALHTMLNLDGEEEEVILSVVKSLRLLADKTSVPPLLRIFRQNTNKEIRESVAEALGEIGGEEALSELAQHVEDESSKLRESAMFAIGMLEDVDAIEHLIKGVDDVDDDVRFAAIVSLGRIGNPKATAPLLKSLEDEVLHNSKASALMLGFLGDPVAIPLIQRKLESLETKWTEEGDKREETMLDRWAYVAALAMLGRLKYLEEDIIDFGILAQDRINLYNTEFMSDIYQHFIVIGRNAMKQSGHPGLLRILEEHQKGLDTNQDTDETKA